MEAYLEQSQRQVLSQEMIQSVEILQMSAQELSDYIREQTLENPLIDAEEQYPQNKDEERLKKLEWLSELDEQNRFYYHMEKKAADGFDFNNISGSRESGLKEALMQQLIGEGYSDREMQVFEYIAESLDDRGYYTCPADETAFRLGISVKEVQRCLEIMKTLEPAGICAGSLKECLLLQLERADYECGTECKIVSSYLEQLGKNHLPLIAKELKIPVKEVMDAQKRIRSLNPRPAQGFGNGGISRYIIPDVTVVKFHHGFEILTNDYVYPAVRINEDYVQMMKGECPEETKEYLCQKLGQARKLQENIRRRNTTLMDITKCILEVHQEFFTSGDKALRPFTMTEAAQQLDLSVSTVSRAVNEKYLQCCYGLFPLSFFFAKSISGKDDCVSAVKVRTQLGELIKNEDKKKPYSDSALAELLAGQGLKISRRTVAKYREMMEIADCRGRKEF